ncbi:hypothetical protein BIW11_00213 [Tropilaelaps mercedesae]|uniref:Uncharacterized protein n=1 Tax=Tropilaelaps mercedesae TaxID=418985 RepID=A0A1V9XZW6_9ACAR|nr:hypothetical protein BIW11_00213 [Tropilaelaps mercedesae]
MHPFTVLTLAVLLGAPWTGVGAKKHAKLAIGGAAVGGAGAVGAGGGFLAGSHIGSLLKHHGHGQGHSYREHGIGHGPRSEHHEKVIVRHVFLKPHQKFPFPVSPIAPIDPIEPIAVIGRIGPIASAPIVVKKPIAPVTPIIHAAPIAHTAPIARGAPIVQAAPIAPIAPIAPATPSATPIVVKKPDPLYKGHLIVKKLAKSRGHHFVVHGYQFSLGRRPVPVILKKHFLLHPSPLVYKPVFIKKSAIKPIIKPVLPVDKPVIPIVKQEGTPVILKEFEPHAPIIAGPIINEGPLITTHNHAQALVPIIKAAPTAPEPIVEHTAPMLEILGPIFNAPLPSIGNGAYLTPFGNKAW